eukprot:2539159-Prymnesium_polylepis.1
MAAVRAHLALPLEAAPADATRAADGVPGGGAAFRKATPDRLCRAVENYAELCRAYRRTEYAADLEDACDADCTS